MKISSTLFTFVVGRKLIRSKVWKFQIIVIKNENCLWISNYKIICKWSSLSRLIKIIARVFIFNIF